MLVCLVVPSNQIRDGLTHRQAEGNERTPYIVMTVRSRTMTASVESNDSFVENDDSSVKNDASLVENDDSSVENGWAPRYL